MNRLYLLLSALLLAACGGALQLQLPAAAPAVDSRKVAALPTASVARVAALPTPAPHLLPTANPAVIDQPILDDLSATARAIAAAPTAAEPTPEPTPAPLQPAAPHMPARIVIGAIDLDRSLVAVGLDEQLEPIVPKHEPAWFSGSAAPGQGDNVVLWGHALRFRDTPNVPAPFGRLSELQAGASIVLYDEQGAAHDYTITQQIWATPDQVDYILPQGEERLTLVSCIGSQVIADDGTVLTMSHRLITIARPSLALTASR